MCRNSFFFSPLIPGPVEFRKKLQTRWLYRRGRLSLNGVNGVYAVTAALLWSYLSSLLGLRMNNRRGLKITCLCGRVFTPVEKHHGRPLE